MDLRALFLIGGREGQGKGRASRIFSSVCWQSYFMMLVLLNNLNFATVAVANDASFVTLQLEANGGLLHGLNIHVINVFLHASL